jgi:UDP-N-acetylglucosamine transferase subunit ALG13
MTGPRIVVLVGTDHHPFDRLVRWINDWIDLRPEAAESVFVQWGTASAYPRCAGARLLDIEELSRLLDQADVIICHGGPASIVDAWRRGQIPIVVPRQAHLGEHVDDHQVDFCRKFASLGRVRLAQDAAVLNELLDEAIANLNGFRSAGAQPDIDAAVARFGELVDELISGPQRKLPLIGLSRRRRRGRRVGTGVDADVGNLARG